MHITTFPKHSLEYNKLISFSRCYYLCMCMCVCAYACTCGCMYVGTHTLKRSEENLQESVFSLYHVGLRS